MFKKPTIITTVFIVLVACLSLPSFSQTYEEWVKQQKQDLDNYKKKEKENFEKFVKERDEMIKKMDQEFSDYLRQAWKDYELSLKPKPAPEPKPVVTPVFDPKKTADQPKTIKAEPDIVANDQPVAPVLPLLQKSEPENFEVLNGQFNFYGRDISFKYDKNFPKNLSTPLNAEIIASAWDQLNTLNYNHLINQLLEFKNEMNLNDWGYYLLIKKASQAITQNVTNPATLIQWFLMVKSNYKARVAYKDNNLFLLLPSVNTIYGVPYFIFDNRQFYLVDSKEMSIYTYDKDFPEARLIMDLNISSPVNTVYKPVKRNLNFEYNEKTYNLTVEYNQNAIDFYKDIPLSDINIYFDAVVAAQTKESLVNQLRPLITGKPETEAVELLLRMVQKSFEYKTDQDQFGYEKFFFPDELFSYPYSDCEDRSVLFAYLVRELLGLEVIGLNYPGHMATAVKFTKDVQGDHVIYNNKKYTVCDPTYIGAPIATAMPQYAETVAKVVELKNRESRYERTMELWKMLNKAGAFRGGNLKDIDYDSQGNAYVTGFFNDTVTLGSFRLKSVEQTNDIFIAKIDPGNKFLWAYKIGGPGSDFGYNLVVLNDKEFYFTGSFTKDIDFAGSTLKAGKKGDVFIAKCPTKGGLIWVNQIGIENLDSTNNVFVANFDPKGNRNWVRVYSESEQFNKFGISVDSLGIAFVSGSLYASTGLNVKTMSYESYTEFNPVVSLRTESDKLVAARYDRNIAGVFAAINLINNAGMSLQGKRVQEAISPTFKKASPTIYENLGKIEFLKNSEGIITIRTSDKNPVVFDAIKIDHDAKIKISTFSSGNAQIDILSGITVGKAYIQYNLNFIKLFKDTGDLLLDYDVDHTQKKINIGKEML